MMRRRAWFALAAGLACGAAAPKAADPAYVARLEAFAEIETLNATLLSHDSATAVLQGWCEAHRLAPPGTRIVALRDRAVEKPLPEAGRKALGIGAGEPVRYRRVRLACAGRVLSEADNWYLPARLTPEMNRALDETDTPFGTAVRALDFRRRNLSAELIDPPLPSGWEMGAKPPAGPFAPPARVLQHTAALTTGAGAPFAYVVETYTGAVLASGR
jgi:chorismate-pyruvate lyase